MGVECVEFDMVIDNLAGWGSVFQVFLFTLRAGVVVNNNASCEKKVNKGIPDICSPFPTITPD